MSRRSSQDTAYSVGSSPPASPLPRSARARPQFINVWQANQPHSYPAASPLYDVVLSSPDPLIDSPTKVLHQVQAAKLKTLHPLDNEKYTQLPQPLSPKSCDAISVAPTQSLTPPTKSVATKPSFWLLFSHLESNDVVFLVLPASIFSVASGLVPLAMSKLVGKAFDCFAKYNVNRLSSSQIPQLEKHTLMSGIVRVVGFLLGLSALTLVLTTIAGSLWIFVAERVAKRLRLNVFSAVVSKKMAWFDVGMQSQDSQENSSDDNANVGSGATTGAGGLMAKISRETDDVRIAVSLHAGATLQHLTTIVSCLFLALSSSWNLTLVILASIPALVLITVVTELITTPLLTTERAFSSQAGHIIERTVLAINHVKAFNAQSKEQKRLQETFAKANTAYHRLVLVWGARFGISSMAVLAMFVQGFWYGSFLVQKGKATPGTVMTVFMACLVVSSMFTLIVQSLSYLEKGKLGAANLQDFIQQSGPPPAVSTVVIPITPAPPTCLSVPNSTAASSTGTTTPPLAYSAFYDRSPSPSSPLSERPRMYSYSSFTSSRSDTQDTLVILSSSESFLHEHRLRSTNTELSKPQPIWISPKKRHYQTTQMSIQDIPHSPSPTTPEHLKFSQHHRRSVCSSPTNISLYTRKSIKAVRGVQMMRKIRPLVCKGEILLRNVGFSYPSRPTVPVLHGVHMFFPACEITYVVGGSGSGKSTIAQLLLRMYEPQQGSIELDDQVLAYLDPDWCRQHIAAVTQTPIVFDASIHDNVAMGLTDSSFSSAGHAEKGQCESERLQVETACRLALLHDFIRDLPDGYDTMLGQKGFSLSGGQQQRLAIARARIRDPTVLILDEATSALDPTSRILVHEAIKAWRKGKTTIVITHDTSQITADDFVYVLHDGIVAEQGYRDDLECAEGLFSDMCQLQNGRSDRDKQETDNDEEERKSQVAEFKRDTSNSLVSNEVEEILFYQQQTNPHISGRNSLFALWSDKGAMARDSFMLWKGNNNDGAVSKSIPSLKVPQRQSEYKYLDDAMRLQMVGNTASSRRVGGANEASSVGGGISPPRRRIETTIEDEGETTRYECNVPIHILPTHQQQQKQGREEGKHGSRGGNGKPTALALPPLSHVVRMVWQTIPSRWALVIGIAISSGAGILTPLFSYTLAQLLATMGKEHQQSAVIRNSLLVLLMSTLEGLFSFLRFSIMEQLANRWIQSLRQRAYRGILAQDRRWFDRPENTAANLCATLTNDAEDARSLVGQIVGQLSLVAVMIVLGLVWAMAVGWQLTLAGLALGPVFIVALSVQSRIVACAESRNKSSRDHVARKLYDVVSNIRGIRAMALEAVFEREFVETVEEAQRSGRRAAIVTGMGEGLGQSLTYLVEAIMFLVGARLVSTGQYDFERMIKVFNLCVFAVSFAAQMLSFLPSLSKTTRALSDLNRLVQLSDHSRNNKNGGNMIEESKGEGRPLISGKIDFIDVGFRYPLRPQVQVLEECRLTIQPGERVAIVGGSGSGKSTLVALLQRLYTASQGRILIDGIPIEEIDTTWLREHMSVVSQHPIVLDATLAENIEYGVNAPVYDPVPTTTTTSSLICNDTTVLGQIQQAASIAQLDDLIRQLPQGLWTQTDGSQLSGGQIQRIAIARALVRTRSKILLLDECTSALDATIQDKIIRHILNNNNNSITTLIVTHKVDIMKRCDRIIVLDKGHIAEQGSYNQLISKKHGLLATLARGGEWVQ